MKNSEIKIIVLGYRALEQRSLDQMCLDELSETFDVEYWNCNALAVPHVPDTTKEVSRPYCIKITSYRDLKKNLSRLPKNTIAIRAIFVNADMYKFYSVVSSKIQCRVDYFLNRNMLALHKATSGDTKSATTSFLSNPSNQSPVSFLKRIKRKLFKNETILLASKYIRYHGDYRYRQYRNSFYCGKIGNMFQYYYTIGARDGVDFKTSHPDYDKILKLGPIDASAKPYIVFVDSWYPYHPDWRNRVPSFDWLALAEPYYHSINLFFDHVEKIYNCEIIVAAHPSADYSINPYGGRKCLQYQSVALVKDAKAVILHVSNSLNFIAYYDKPFCMITNNAIKAGDFPKCLYSMQTNVAKQLNVPLINIDASYDINSIFTKLEPETRKQYINSYFGDTSQNVPNSEILKHHFESIYKIISCRKDS